MADLLPLDDAQKALISAATKLGTEYIDITAALGRTAAQDVVSLRNQPAADMSAMDGYAICYDANITTWEIIGECKAGAPPCDAIEPHLAARIFTGALLPEGADTIIIQENIMRKDDRIEYSSDTPINLGQNIRRKGGDFAQDETIIKAGTRINPAQIGYAIAAGHDRLCVYKSAKIAIISTGDELRKAGESCAPYQIPASNGPMIAALLHGYDIIYNDVVSDDLASIKNIISNHQHSDVIITIGGASVGDHDLILPALEELGADIAFMKAAIKPGKPIMTGRLGNSHIIALPGNPSSAYVTAILFLLPLVHYISGLEDYLPPTRKSISAKSLPKTGVRAEFLRAIINGDRVIAFSSQDSGKLSTLASANALIIRDSESMELEAGEDIYYIPINHL